MEAKSTIDYFKSGEIKEIINTDKVRMSMVEYEGNYCILKQYKGRNLIPVYMDIIDLQRKSVCEYLAFVHAVEYFEGDTYIIEEYLAGETLAEHMENDGLISENDFVRIVSKICDALEYLHYNEPQIIHRDIKPKNIMLFKNGSVKLFDFDISRVSKENQSKDTILMGTEEYMAPEQRGSSESGTYSDVYSLGVTMCEMLSGQLPRYTRNGLEMPDCGKYSLLIQKCVKFDYTARISDVKNIKKELLYLFNESNNMCKIVEKHDDVMRESREDRGETTTYDFIAFKKDVYDNLIRNDIAHESKRLVYEGDSLYSKKLRQVGKSIKYFYQGESIKVVYDDSLTGNGKCGMVITNMRIIDIYMNNSINIQDIIKVEAMEKTRVNIYSKDKVINIPCTGTYKLRKIIADGLIQLLGLNTNEKED